MKKYLLIILLLIAGTMVQSQVLITLIFGDKLNSDGLEFGLEGGANWTNISAMETNKLASKWNLGFYFDVRLKKQWFLYTGVLVKSNFGVDKLSDADMNTLGTKIYFDNNGNRLEGDYNQKINSFMVPALVRYKFKNYMYVEAGPQFSLMYNSFVQFDTKVDDSEATFKQYNKDKINKIDAGVMGGVGYKLSHRKTGWTLGLKYYYGFVNVFKGISGTNNSSIYLKLEIPIGAGEKAQKKKEERRIKKEKKSKEKSSGKKN
jgi:hypothetical protein